MRVKKEVQSNQEVPDDRKVNQFLGSPSPEALSPPRSPEDIALVHRALKRLAKMPDVRPDKVQAVKAALAKGRYITPDKLKLTTARLSKDL